MSSLKIFRRLVGAKAILALIFLLASAQPAPAIQFNFFSRLYQKIFGRFSKPTCDPARQFPEVKKQLGFFDRILGRASGAGTFKAFRDQLPKDPKHVIANEETINEYNVVGNIKNLAPYRLSLPVADDSLKAFYDEILVKDPVSAKDQKYKQVYNQLKSPSARLHLLLEWRSPPPQLGNLEQRIQLTDELFGKDTEVNWYAKGGKSVQTKYQLTQGQIQKFWHEVVEAPPESTGPVGELRDRFNQAKKTDERLAVVNSWLKTKPPTHIAQDQVSQEVFDSRKMFVQKYANELFNIVRENRTVVTPGTVSSQPLNTNSKLNTQVLGKFFDQVMDNDNATPEVAQLRARILAATNSVEEKNLILEWYRANPQ